jgi:two-component system response regulator DesR
MPSEAARNHSCAMPSPDAAIRVYLADDHRPVRERVKGMLEEAGMAVVGEGATPGDCIAGILDARPDVVVLDIQLEGGSGLEVLKSIRGAAASIAFVVFSNNTGPAYRKRYLGAGASAFLDKSADFDALGRAVTAACRPQNH